MNGSLPKGAGRTTLKEIARAAGVSVSTASVVLSGKSGERRISEEAAQRVREVALQRDYSPNLLVRSLQRGRTHVLGFYSAFKNREQSDLYMDRLSSAVERAAGSRGYDLLLHCDFHRPAEHIYQFLNGGMSDGLIFFGPHRNDPLLRLLRGSRLPTVLLLQMDEEDALSAVTDDMAAAMEKIAEELVVLGHRRIAAIANATESLTDAPVRIALLRRYLARYNVALPEERVIPLTEREPEIIDASLRRLFAENDPPTALFCWHDRIGYKVLESCERLKITVPERLSLIGYDGLHWPSTSAHVLASMEVPIVALVDEAVELLDQLILGKAMPPVCKSLIPTLSRGTTLAPP